MASLVAAEEEVRGLLCIAYPLSGSAEARTAHWARIGCPALIVNGEADELADPAELRRRLPLLRRGRLELMAGAGHALGAWRDEVLDLAAAFLSSL